MKLINPYKTKEHHQQCRKIIADVGQEDWDHIFNACPMRGSQDAIIGSLVHAFAQAIKNHNLPKHYEPTNPSIIEGLLQGITFPSTNRPRRDQARRPSEKVVSGSHPGETPVRTDKEVGGEKDSRQNFR